MRLGKLHWRQVTERTVRPLVVVFEAPSFDRGLCMRVDVMQAVHFDRRLSPILADGTRVKPSITTYLEAGCGFGGSCFPKDIKALIAHGKKAGNSMQLLEAVISVNTRQPYKVLELLRQHFPELDRDAWPRYEGIGFSRKPVLDQSPAGQRCEQRSAVQVATSESC